MSINYKGFSLIEVLVTMVVMSVGMLGLASMLIISHKASNSNYLKQQAVQSAYNIIDRMRANRQAVSAGNYNVSNLVAGGTPSIPNSPGTDCGVSACTFTQLAAYDNWHWLAKDVSVLPSGCGSIATTVNGQDTLVTVTVQWDDSPAQRLIGVNGAPPGANANLVQFVIGTSI